MKENYSGEEHMPRVTKKILALETNKNAPML